MCSGTLMEVNYDSFKGLNFKQCEFVFGMRPMLALLHSFFNAYMNLLARESLEFNQIQNYLSVLISFSALKTWKQAERRFMFT